MTNGGAVPPQENIWKKWPGRNSKEISIKWHGKKVISYDPDREKGKQVSLHLPLQEVSKLKKPISKEDHELLRREFDIKLEALNKPYEPKEAMDDEPALP